MSKEGKVSRRSFVLGGSRLVGAAGAMAALSACAATPQVVEKVVKETVEVEKVVKETVVVEATTAPRSAVVQILMPEFGEYYDQILVDTSDWFREDHPEVTFEWSFAQQHQEKLLTQIASGLAPDITYVNYINGVSIAYRGVLLPMDEWFAAAGLSTDDFLYGVMHSYIWRGRAYAMPITYDAMGFYWNKNVYEEVGLDPEQPPRTIAELEAHSDKILLKDDAGNIQRIGYSPSSSTFVLFAFMRGGQFYDAENDLVTADDPPNVEDLEWEVAQVEKLDVDRMSSFWSAAPGYSSPGNPFTVNTQGLVYGGWWNADFYEKVEGLRYGFTNVPSLTGDPAEQEKLFQPSWAVAVPQGAKEPEWAWRYIKYFTVDNGVECGLHAEQSCCYLPIVEEWIDRWVEEKMAGQIKEYGKEFFTNAMLSARWWPAMPVAAMYNTEVSRAYDFAIHGQGTPAEVLAKTRETVQAELDGVLAALGG
ncbi:MAG: extracellular solute-binding protein [Anaerolineae bacterium]|nr:extracellular solute-binding protein [Anaerolineae bacterium]